MRLHTATLAAAFLVTVALANLALVGPATARKRPKQPPAAAPAPKTQSGDTQKTEAELQAVKSEIERVARQVSNDEVEKSRLAKELRSAEVSVSKAREGLDEVRRQRSEAAAQRTSLATQKKQREGDLAQEREGLAGQLRAAYMIGREEPLKLLLNQRDPARAGRMFVYYRRSTSWTVSCRFRTRSSRSWKSRSARS
jgi:septal ring factor EnvC (AmiA/AmiB activator)